MEDGEDPLDAYMASLDSEVVKQATLATNVNIRVDHISPHSMNLIPRPSASKSDGLRENQRHIATENQIAIANKVMESPYCDVFGKENRSRQRFYAGTEKGLGVDDRKEKESCLRLIMVEPAEFLRRYGHILAPDDLDSFLPSDDPDVGTHVVRLKALKLQQRRLSGEDGNDASDMDMEDGGRSLPTLRGKNTRDLGSSVGTQNAHGGAPHSRNRQPGYPPADSHARNRRFRRLQQLMKEGKWFSDEAMKDRDPWLWYEHVGKVDGEERPAPRESAEEVPGYTTVRTYLQESLGFLSQQPKEGEWLGSLSGARGTGQTLGMAFLSNACTPGTQKPSVVGADREMDTHANVKAAPGRRALERSEDTPILEVAAGGSVDLSDAQVPGAMAGTTASSSGTRTSTEEAARAALERCSISGDQEIAEAMGEGSRRVHFAEPNEGDRTACGNNDGCEGDDMEEEEEADDGVDGADDEGARGDVEDDSEEESEWGEPGGREEVARVLAERFLAGEEVGVDYALMDADETLDDLDQLGRDEQDRWFRSQGDEVADQGT